MDNRLELENGYELSFPKQSEKYTIIGVIGRGASTIAYLAQTEFGKCILKEYCPQNLHLVRDSFGHLQCTTSRDLERFERGKQEFVAAGNRQQEIRNIICNETPPVLSIYEANNTQYAVVVVFAGKTFDQLSDESLPIKIKICRAIAKLINQYHQKGYLCLDIKPNNIFVLTNSSGEIDTTIIEYIDFDSIRKKDELSFGRSISYTKNWAAPEQTNPYRYSDICEATDIYTLGELVFWSVFNRHSYDLEHRDYSVYPFNETKYPKVKRNIVQNILTELFHSTLRPSPRNRFQTMGELIQLLDKLVEEFEKKEYIIEAAIQPKEFFIGRDNELRQIDNALHKHDIVFVSGIAGIGKSELVKHYICAHKKEYDNILYWTYNGDIDNMVAQDITVNVSGLQKIPEESDLQYAERKLRLVNELTSNNKNLIVIDNLNQLIDELPQERTWERIKALHGKILITTRACENLYQSVTINTLSNTNDLIRLFREYCPFSDEEFESVYGIINSVDHHTLLVELLAHLTKATHTSPGQTLEKLQNNGITGLSNETVRLLKDNRISSDSVHEHIKKIFSMETISDNHILILAMLAFLPIDGVTASKFTSFFSIENYESINWLINHGWISSMSGVDNIAEDTIKIHPAIASVVVEYLNTKENLREDFFKRNCGAIKNHNFKQLSEAEQVRLADSLASSTIKYSIKCRSAAIFINQYIDQYSKYGNVEQKRKQIEFAIEVLDSSIGIGKYSAVLEESYYLQASILYTLQKHDRVIQICEEHLARAKQVNDIYFIAKWYLMLEQIYGSERFLDSPKYWKYTHLATNYIKKNITKSPAFLCSNYLTEKLDYDYLELKKDKFPDDLELILADIHENRDATTMFYSQYPKALQKMRILELNQVKNLYELVKKKEGLNKIDYDCKIKMIQAKIAFLSSQYQKAENLLNELIEFHTESNFHNSLTTYYIHQFLAQIALRKEPQDYTTAISEFKYCLKIAEDLSLSNTYMEQSELGYLYIICGRWEEAEIINTELIKETHSLAPEIRKTSYADALRNMGYLHYNQGKRQFDIEVELIRAIQEYSLSIAPGKLVSFGQARTWWCLANCESSELKKIESLEIAIDAFNKCVGLNHPEAKECLAQLDELKSRQK